MATLPEKEAPVPGLEETFPVTVEEEPKIDKKATPLIEELEQDISLTQPITDDYGQVLVSAPAPQQPKIVLPVTKNQYTFGLKQKVSDSIRWLTEWCRRLVKIFGPKATFREAENKV